jgi:hypothetical protein
VIGVDWEPIRNQPAEFIGESNQRRMDDEAIYRMPKSLPGGDGCCEIIIGVKD